MTKEQHVTIMYGQVSGQGGKEHVPLQVDLRQLLPQPISFNPIWHLHTWEELENRIWEMKHIK